MSGDNRLLRALFRDMRRIRSLEERVGELFVRSPSAGSMLHLSIGEEGVECHNKWWSRNRGDAPAGPRYCAEL